MPILILNPLVMHNSEATTGPPFWVDISRFDIFVVIFYLVFLMKTREKANGRTTSCNVSTRLLDWLDRPRYVKKWQLQFSIDFFPKDWVYNNIRNLKIWKVQAKNIYETLIIKAPITQPTHVHNSKNTNTLQDSSHPYNNIDSHTEVGSSLILLYFVIYCFDIVETQIIKRYSFKMSSYAHLKILI